MKTQLSWHWEWRSPVQVRCLSWIKSRKRIPAVESSYSTYPVLLHIEVVQMYLICSAWASEEVFAFLRVQAATEAVQPRCHATVCSTAFKCPAKFNSPGSDREGILTMMVQIAHTFYLQTDFAACRVSLALNCTWLNCLKKKPRYFHSCCISQSASPKV